MKYWFGLILFFFSTFTMAQDPIYTGTFSNKALDGYDTVAYFTEGKPVKGVAQFKTEYQGAEWLFASQQNLDAFLADPENTRRNMVATVHGRYLRRRISRLVIRNTGRSRTVSFI